MEYLNGMMIIACPELFGSMGCYGKYDGKVEPVKVILVDTEDEYKAALKFAEAHEQSCCLWVDRHKQAFCIDNKGGSVYAGLFKSLDASIAINKEAWTRFPSGYFVAA